MKELDDLINLCKNHAAVSNFCLIIGKSVKNEPIFAFHYGKFSAPQILLTASTHAREYMSTAVGFEMIENCAFESIGVWFVPLVNPDGVKIVLEDGQNLYKANANLVDINVNFDANWGQGKSNLFVPHFENYVGPYPNSEIETRTLTNFVSRLSPALVINLHTKGEVIYFGDFLTNENKGKDAEIAKKLSKITGFSAIKTSGSFGGFSDFCEMKLNIPSLTIELGSDTLSHPISLSKSALVSRPVKNVLSHLDSSQHWRKKSQ